MDAQFVLETLYLQPESELAEAPDEILQDLIKRELIEKTDAGYRLCENADALCANDLIPLCPKEFRVEVRDRIDSTNQALMEQAKAGAPEGSLLLAGCQTQGVGRMGRPFFSPEDSGLYMSLLLRPGEDADSALSLTTIAAVAVCRTLHEMGLPAQIKWVNDIYLYDRKVCGILAQAGWKADGSGLDFVVVGIGINVYPPKGGFPGDISDIAASLQLPRRSHTRAEIASRVMTQIWEASRNLSDHTYIEEYRRYSFLPGKNLWILRNGDRIAARCLGIDDECHLLIEYEDGRKDALSSGEVSVRIRE